MNPCPHREELELLIAESLDNQVEQEVEAHVETCSDCQETLAGLVSAELPSDSDSGPAPPFLNRLLELNPAFEMDDDWQSLLDECDDAGALGAIGDYIVYEEVGAGAMGVVLKAKDPQLDRMVAIKIIRPELIRHSQYQERFVREAQSMAAIDDPHVVPIYRVSRHKDVPYIVMKYLEGETLADHLKREGTLGNDALRKLGVQIASGLSAVHARGTIHRDLKPSNIWMEAPNGHVRVMDFGLARPEQGPRTTNYDGIIGTPAYMAPEQAQGGAADSRSDLFSLGSVLYEAASGKLPFPGENPLAILSRMATESAAPIRSAVPEIEPAIGNLIDDLVERGAEERPASAGEVISRLTDQAVDASNSKFLGFKLTGILFFGFVMLCGIIFTLKTPTGEIIVELAEGVDPDSVQIQVEGNDLVKVLSEGNWTLDIREGKYNLEMQQGDDRFQLDAKSIVVRRDEQAFLKVQIKSRETTTPMETRSIAQWVLSIGGSISFYKGGHLRTAPKPKPLPTGEFTLVGIDLRDTNATDEDLKRINNLPDLEHIKLRPLEGASFTEEGFQILAEANLPRLSKLWVRDCTTRKAALEQIARLDLSELSLHNTQTTDEDLEGLSPLDDLTYLRLAILPIDGSGLQHLTNAPLQTIELFNVNCDDDTFSKTPQWPQLRHFKIAYGTFTNRGLGDLSQRYQQLESIAIKGTMQGTKIDHRGIEELARLPNLKSLAITDRQQTGFLKQDEIIDAIADLKQLRTLELEDSCLTDEELKSDKFLQLKNLSTLTFSGKSNFSQDAIESLKDRLPNCAIWRSNAPWKD